MVNTFTDGMQKVLIAKALTQTDKNSFCNYLTSFNIDTLKDQYINPSVDDGSREVVILKVGNKKKKMEVSCTYQKTIDGLFDIINNVTADEKYKIKYTK
jgi:hypothetical protein